MGWKKSLALKTLDRMPKNISPAGHSVIDILMLGGSVLAAMALSMPGLMEIKSGAGKWYFYGWAAATALMIGMTDFTGAGRRGQVQREVVHAEL